MSKDAKIFNTFPTIDTLNDDGVFLVGQKINNVLKFRQFTKAGFESQYITPNVLQEYDFTPTLKFNNVSTGIEYNQQIGKLYLGKNYGVISVDLILTNKGSATGNATINGAWEIWNELGLDLNVFSSTASVHFLELNSGVESVTGLIAPGLYNFGVRVINLTKVSAGNSIQLTEADFTNGTQIRFSLPFVFNRL